MENISLEGTYNTPSIDFNAQTGELKIEGRSIPEHANMFYTPLIDWVKELAAGKPESVTLSVKVDYMNSSSQKFMLELFEKLEPIQASGGKVVVRWHYESDDEEMKDAGEEFRDCIHIPFEIIPVDEF